MNNEQIVRRAYELAEKVNIKGWWSASLPTGRLPTCRSASRTAGPTAPPAWARQSSFMRRRFRTCIANCTGFLSIGDVVVVKLALQGTHKGPLPTPMGIIPPTGTRMDAPCCDVFRLVNGKIQSFNCYPSGTVTFAQLGVLSNIEAAIARA